MLVGRDRNQISLLVQPAPGQNVDPMDPKQLADFRNAIWFTILLYSKIILFSDTFYRSSVEKANRESATYARIFKELILVTTPGKPLPLTPKGSLMFKQSLILYAEEIEQLYTDMEKAGGGDGPMPSSWSAKGIREWVAVNVKELLDVNVVLDETKDLFDMGVDRCVSVRLHDPSLTVV